MPRLYDRCAGDRAFRVVDRLDLEKKAHGMSRHLIFRHSAVREHSLAALIHDLDVAALQDCEYERAVRPRNVVGHLEAEPVRPERGAGRDIFHDQHGRQATEGGEAGSL